ncbi:SDR family NAD(P)-dependent oxidoreductase [Mycobacterium sp. PDNC021]|uniref:SDR family NAD(P)-dependent oxidoreductase n=1 Tax=Mycobacterium sp. PDNC021 TaxID=3391399 RepID=UPI003AB09897
MAPARQQTYSLDGKVVFLTGAGGGLGAATAALLTHRGAQVALADIDLSAAERTARTLPPGQVLPVDCDVTATDSVHAAVREVEDQFGLPVLPDLA